MALEDYDGAFGPFNDILSPAMGRLMSTNPEAIIPHLAAAGIAPEHLEQDLPPSPDVAVPQSEPIEGTPGMPTFTPPMQPGLLSDPLGTSQRFLSGAAKAFGGGAAPPAAAVPPPAPADQFGGGAGPFNTFGDLGAFLPPALPRAPAVPAPGDPSATGSPVPLPQADPRKSAGNKQQQDAMKALGDVLSGIKAPPAPAQPQVRPHTTPAAHQMPQGGGLASLLAQFMGGANPQAIRLLQAIGKEGR